jgi:hypothetical protein
VKINPRDLTKNALQSIVEQLLSSDDATGRSIMRNLGRQARQQPPEKNDLADLHEEMHGKYDAPMVEDGEDDTANDYDDDNGVKTARVQGPPSKKPVRSRGGDEDMSSKRGGGRIRPARSADDEDTPTSRNVPRFAASQDEDVSPRRKGRTPQRNDQDLPGPKRTPRMQRAEDEDLA